ncbi:hypothetical protein A2160_04520 [Candidatus Beckwithbacteria bacterium RBG_13_42_9]|uniref:Nudix hydrolase domain-containing protein n=1 Tax=Candidatus Beckwithbacteria bacterium RBG_13_42_9 TaxID=1797457 RepID=A0A1F5E9E6_9BACT|nr:MAG: hypothetical protein A2160_04520 [Candidatus Beckwithbacteria bacterium RBG_13_42_9]
MITDSQNKILLLHRNTPARSQWEIPGGKLEAGEKSETAAQGEVKEELGIAIQIIKRLGQHQFSEDQNQMIYTWFQAKITSGSPKIMEKEKFDQLKYLALDKLTKMKPLLSANTQNFLEEYLSDKIKLS